MRFYLDSADTQAARHWLASGVFHGVTTNPTILQRAGLPTTLATVDRLIGELHSLGAREVQVQAWGEQRDRLLACARQILRSAEQHGANVVIKLPVTRDGCEAAVQLGRDGHPVTITAVYAAHQALLAHLAGAAYVAPYLGRMNDNALDGRAEILTMQRSLSAHASATQVLVASLRGVEDISTLAAHGVSCFTMSETIAKQLFDNPLTIEAAAAFEATAAGSPA